MIANAFSECSLSLVMSVFIIPFVTKRDVIRRFHIENFSVFSLLKVTPSIFLLLYLLVLVYFCRKGALIRIMKQGVDSGYVRVAESFSSMTIYLTIAEVDFWLSCIRCKYQ